MATTRTQSSTPSRRPRAGQGSVVAQYDFFLLGVVSILVGLGLVMIFSASFAQSNRSLTGRPITSCGNYNGLSSALLLCWVLRSSIFAF